MSDVLTFAQLARLCTGLAGAAEATMTRTEVQQALRLGAAAASDALTEAEEFGYVAGDATAWRLTERGARLASTVLAATGEQERRNDQLFTRPFTDWFPSGEEDLG